MQFAGIIINKVEQYSNKCKTAINEASRKGARLNKRHAEGWDEIVNDTNGLILSETEKIIADINQITDAMRARKQRPNYSTQAGIVIHKK